MIIRRLTPADAIAYRELRLHGLLESPTAFGASYAQEAGRSPEEIAARLTGTADGGSCIFGSFAGEQLMGMLSFVRARYEKRLHIAELAGMYVAKEFRQHGFGGALLDAAILHARSLGGLRQLTLSVNATNTAARRLYQSRGFTCFGTEPDALYVDGCYYAEEFYFLRLTGLA